MIIEQKVLTKITSKNVKHYEALGYEPVFHIDSGGVKRLKQKEILIDVHELPLTSHTKVKVACDVCGEVQEIEYRHAIKSKNNACSNECLNTIKRNRILEKLEKITGMNFKDYLYGKYVIEKMTTRQIAIDVYGNINNATTIKYWLNEFKIPMRHGSEAIKTQWINADDRRKQAREIAKKTILTKHSRDKMRKIMQSTEYKLKSRKAKLGEKNPMFGVRGEEHPNWNPELTDEDRIKERKSFEDNQWRLSVYRRDRFKCQKCGLNKNLNAHHILNHKSHKDLRYDVDNGITLCETCHIEFHKTYGYFDNTKEQINEYLQLKVTQ